MRKLLLAALLVTSVSAPVMTSADTVPVIYPTLADCKAALEEARDLDPIYWAAECRPSPHGTGWIFTIKGDHPDNKGSGM
jgi:hypothetical protein